VYATATAENEVADLRRMLDRGREAEQGLREQLLESQQAHAAAEATLRALEVRPSMGCHVETVQVGQCRVGALGGRSML
jgi:hypothetical protein